MRSKRSPYSPRASLTTTEITCCEPRWCSVVLWPSRNLICSRSPPFLQRRCGEGHGRRSARCRSAWPLNLSRIRPPLRMERSSRPRSSPAAEVQASMPCFTHTGMATMRIRSPLPRRSAITQRPSRIWISSIYREDSSSRRRAQPTSSAKRGPQ
jgi:hypothetical protein